MLHTNNFHKHIQIHHSTWIKNLWLERNYVKLLWFARDMGRGPFSDYIFYFAAQGLAGEADGMPEFCPERNGAWRDAASFCVPFLNMPYPPPRAGEPVDGLQPKVVLPGEVAEIDVPVEVKRCGICFDPIQTLERWVNFHDDIHPFCLDCLDAMIANEVNRRLNSGLNPVISVLACPMCRTSVRMNLIQEAMDNELMRGRARSAATAVGAPMAESLERIIPYRVNPAPPPPLLSTGWITRRPRGVSSTVNVTIHNRSLFSGETLEEQMSSDASGC